MSKYESYTFMAVHSTVSMEKYDFIIYPTKGWLDASPDGRVMDPISYNPGRIIEVKYPYGEHEVTPEEACTDPKSSCKLKDSKVCLRKTHQYYHQVRLQLYVGTDLYNWCDFCINTYKGFSVQCISPDCV